MAPWLCASGCLFPASLHCSQVKSRLPGMGRVSRKRLRWRQGTCQCQGPKPHQQFPEVLWKEVGMRRSGEPWCLWLYIPVQPVVKPVPLLISGRTLPLARFFLTASTAQPARLRKLVNPERWPPPLILAGGSRDLQGSHPDTAPSAVTS